MFNYTQHVQCHLSLNCICFKFEKMLLFATQFFRLLVIGPYNI